MSNISEEEKLSWGDVDFIEESTPFYNVPLEFQDVDKIEISESESKSSPYKLIGRVRGCIAPINCLSRNGRLYESSHWEKILSKPELQERIASRRFMGMISHENKKIDDRNFKAGEISHICSLLEVRNDDNGKPFLYGELDILDTPAGRILKAMYEGGAGLYVSTRAAGKLLEAAGKPYKIVDSDSYYVDSIDFVLNPGFLQAKPVFEEVKTEPIQPQIHESQQPTITVSSAAPITSVSATPTLTVATSSSPVAVAEASQVEELKSQVEKLAKIVEKVVDDVYEEETPKETSANEDKKEALVEAVTRIAAMHLPEDSFELVLDMLKKGIN